MTQLNFTINQEDIQNLINESVDNNIAKSILTKIYNELMEKERDEYLENKAYQRDPNRNTYRNIYYERDYTIRNTCLAGSFHSAYKAQIPARPY